MHIKTRARESSPHIAERIPKWGWMYSPEPAGTIRFPEVTAGPRALFVGRRGYFCSGDQGPMPVIRSGLMRVMKPGALRYGSGGNTTSGPM